MKNSVNNNGNRIVVAFHIGRGGRFYNAGHRTFIGEKNFQELIQESSCNLYYHDRDEKGRFCKPYLADASGKTIVEADEMNNVVGRLDWDGSYDTDYACYLDECNEDELRIIVRDNQWISPEAREYIVEWFKEDETMIEHLSHLYGWDVPAEHLQQVAD
ncbi:MAG: hypothetical protein IJP79_07280 [Paludibacteraceae bacterium]|nr:hypothetical protein [Paludibacteraceae bacterium]MBQ7748275.1 hypothetical protein [Paludibacteraceae bacterium]